MSTLRTVLLFLALLLAISSCKTLDCGCPMTEQSEEQAAPPAEKSERTAAKAAAR